LRASIGKFSREDRLKASLIAAVTVVDAVWIVASGYRFESAGSARVAGLTLMLLAVAEAYRRWRPHLNFVIMARESAWLIAFFNAAGLLSNLAITLRFPVVDRYLAAFGQWVGFDWDTWFALVTAHPWLSLLFSFVYTAALPQIVLVMLALALVNRLDRARELVLAAMIGGLIAIAIATVFPSAGALAYFRPPQALNVTPTVVDLAYKQTFFDLRNGLVTTFSVDGVKGLIAFPSVHAILSVLIVLSVRGVPRIFWPMAALNVLVLASALVEGGHFLADILGGAAVGVLSLALAAAWRRHLEPAAGALEIASPKPAAAAEPL